MPISTENQNIAIGITLAVIGGSICGYIWGKKILSNQDDADSDDDSDADSDDDSSPAERAERANNYHSANFSYDRRIPLSGPREIYSFKKLPPLFVAIKKKDIESIIKLLEAGEDLNERYDGQTAREYAEKDTDTINAINRYIQSITPETYMNKVGYNRMQKQIQKLDQQKFKDLMEGWNQSYNSGSSQDHNEKLTEVSNLLEAKVNPNEYFRTLKTTPLFIAIQSLDDDLLTLLLEHGADPNIQYNGQTAIEYAKTQNWDNGLRIMTTYLDSQISNPLSIIRNAKPKPLVVRPKNSDLGTVITNSIQQPRISNIQPVSSSNNNPESDSNPNPESASNPNGTPFKYKEDTSWIKLEPDNKGGGKLKKQSRKGKKGRKGRKSVKVWRIDI